jgi:hypothetical protein
MTSLRKKEREYTVLLSLIGWRVDMWQGQSVKKESICGEGIYLWRGDLSPIGCAAAANPERSCLTDRVNRFGTAALSIGDKSPRHINPLTT